MLSLLNTTSGNIDDEVAKDRLSGELAKPEDRTMARRILVERQMRSEIDAIMNVGSKNPAQMGLAKDDDVIEASRRIEPISLSA